MDICVDWGIHRKAWVSPVYDPSQCCESEVYFLMSHGDMVVTSASGAYLSLG